MAIRLTEKDLARLNKNVRAKLDQKDAPPIKTGGELKPSVRARQPQRMTAAKLRDEIGETDLSATITADAERSRGLFVIRLQSGGIPIDYKVKSGQIKRRYITFCKAGTPDKFLLPGVPVFLEVKKKGKTAAAKQTEVHLEIRAGGALCFVVDTFDDYETVLRVLDENAEIVGKIREMMVYLQNAADLCLAANKTKEK